MARRNVVIACFPGVEVLDIAGLASVFSRATVLLGGGAGYDVRLADISDIPRSRAVSSRRRCS